MNPHQIKQISATNTKSNRFLKIQNQKNPSNDLQHMKYLSRPQPKNSPKFRGNPENNNEPQQEKFQSSSVLQNSRKEEAPAPGLAPRKAGYWAEMRAIGILKQEKRWIALPSGISTVWSRERGDTSRDHADSHFLHIILNHKHQDAVTYAPPIVLVTSSSYKTPILTSRGTLFILYSDRERHREKREGLVTACVKGRTGTCCTFLLSCLLQRKKILRGRNRGKWRGEGEGEGSRSGLHQIMPRVKRERESGRIRGEPSVNGAAWRCAWGRWGVNKTEKIQRGIFNFCFSLFIF